jgi:hypothetical protein
MNGRKHIRVRGIVIAHERAVLDGEAFPPERQSTDHELVCTSHSLASAVQGRHRRTLWLVPLPRNIRAGNTLPSQRVPSAHEYVRPPRCVPRSRRAFPVTQHPHKPQTQPDERKKTYSCALRSRSLTRSPPGTRPRPGFCTEMPLDYTRI